MYFGTTPTRVLERRPRIGRRHERRPRDWFLAEGATGGFFDTFILLSNPQTTPAQVTVRYLLDTGETVTVPKTMPANARLTIEHRDGRRSATAQRGGVDRRDVRRADHRRALDVLAGRGAALGRRRTTASASSSAGTRWGLAEGRVGGPLNFHTFILLANPQATAADVTVTFLREGGAPIVQDLHRAADEPLQHRRARASTGLKDESFGALIPVTNDVPIIVERSMYWDVNGIAFSGGTNATGITLPASVP